MCGGAARRSARALLNQVLIFLRVGAAAPWLTAFSARVCARPPLWLQYQWSKKLIKRHAITLFEVLHSNGFTGDVHYANYFMPSAAAPTLPMPDGGVEGLLELLPPLASGERGIDQSKLLSFLESVSGRARRCQPCVCVGWVWLMFCAARHAVGAREARARTARRRRRRAYNTCKTTARVAAADARAAVWQPVRVPVVTRVLAPRDASVAVLCRGRAASTAACRRCTAIDSCGTGLACRALCAPASCAAALLSACCHAHPAGMPVDPLTRPSRGCAAAGLSPRAAA